jgi:hypothetical protein
LDEDIELLLLEDLLGSHLDPSFPKLLALNIRLLFKHKEAEHRVQVSCVISAIIILQRIEVGFRIFANRRYI